MHRLRRLWWMSLALAGLAVLGVGHAHAQDAPSETIALWPQGTWPQVVRGPEKVGNDGSATGAVSNISKPRMEIYRAAQPNGSAVLIAAGGGYFRIQIGTAGRPIARWLSSIGVTAAVLYYRLPGDGWPPVSPFQDGQRAMRLLRHNAARLGIDPTKIGVMGSSAGGNLAGILSTRFDYAFYPANDEADRLSARPDFLAMLYPVVSLKPPLDNTRSRRELGVQPDAVEAYSVELHARPDMPPVFLAHAADDPIANVGHSLAMFDATHKQGVPVELHIFDQGKHSWGLGKPGTQVAQWPRLFTKWARAHGFLGPAPDPSPAATAHTRRKATDASSTSVTDTDTEGRGD